MTTTGTVRRDTLPWITVAAVIACSVAVWAATLGNERPHKTAPASAEAAQEEPPVRISNAAQNVRPALRPVPRVVWLPATFAPREREQASLAPSGTARTLPVVVDASGTYGAKGGWGHFLKPGDTLLLDGHEYLFRGTTKTVVEPGLTCRWSRFEFGPVAVESTK